MNLNLQNLKIGNMINQILQNKFNQLYKFQFNKSTNNNDIVDVDVDVDDIDMDNMDIYKLNQWYDELNHVIVPFIIQDFKDGWI